MTRSTLPIAVALAASAGLLLTACGGGGSGSSDKIQPPATGSTTSAVTSSPSATRAAGPGAPRFDLPPDIKVEFSGFSSSDPTDKLLLQDATYAATAVVETQALGKTKETPNLKRYFTGVHGAVLADQLIAYARTGNIATGLVRYYAPKLTVNKQEGSVTLKFCEDQRKAYDKNAKSGKVNVTSPSLKSFNAWIYQMSKGASGEWKIFNYSWLHGVEQCQAA